MQMMVGINVGGHPPCQGRERVKLALECLADRGRVTHATNLAISFARDVPWQTDREPWPVTADRNSLTRRPPCHHQACTRRHTTRVTFEDTPIYTHRCAKIVCIDDQIFAHSLLLLYPLGEKVYENLNGDTVLLGTEDVLGYQSIADIAQYVPIAADNPRQQEHISK